MFEDGPPPIPGSVPKPAEAMLDASQPSAASAEPAAAPAESITSSAFDIPTESNALPNSGVRSRDQQIQLDQQQMSSFQRATLSPVQKGLLFLVVGSIITCFLGIGVWLFVVLIGEGDSAQTDEGAEIILDGDTEQEASEMPSHLRDTDGDGLKDIDEVKYGTDSTVVDTDGDGFTDGEEVAGGYNPNGDGLLDE